LFTGPSYFCLTLSILPLGSSFTTIGTLLAQYSTSSSIFGFRTADGPTAALSRCDWLSSGLQNGIKQVCYRDEKKKKKKEKK
jgi:hypothetical protein